MVQRPKSPVAVIVILLVPVVLVALYGVGYFGLAKSQSQQPCVRRIYPHVMLASFYFPLAFVEAKTTGKLVVMRGPGTEGYVVQP